MLIVVVGAALGAVPGIAVAEGVKGQKGTEETLLVGNNWDGTADVVDPVGFKRITRINIVPDLAIRRAEIMSDPVDTGFYLGIRQLIGEGNDQLVDDMFTSPDGRFMYVSRPSLKDVVAFNLRTRQIHWRTEVEGQPRRPHGHLARREAVAGVGLDGEQGARDRHRQRQDRGQLRVG